MPRKNRKTYKQIKYIMHGCSNTPNKTRFKKSIKRKLMHHGNHTGGSFYKHFLPKLPHAHTGLSMPLNKYSHFSYPKLGGSHNKHCIYKNCKCNTCTRHKNKYILNKTNKTNKTNKKHYKRGGGMLMPQDLVNVGQYIGFNGMSAYNSLNGYNQPINPNVTNQMMSSVYNKIIV